ncbi:PLP-dependent aminotransferase family protein [Nonomuraea dietziae]|uniref:aminotransferase-like domain-containing protein n=1 Tax=Nonomuraea dietziae TaxID=65515 RepID=UPI0031E172F1
MEPIDLPERLGQWAAGRGPLYLLLASALRRLIDDGELPGGTLLPPDRALAATLAVGRTTVVNAYEQLQAEGKIVRRQGSGTRVAGPTSRQDTSGATLLSLGYSADEIIQLVLSAPPTPPTEVIDAYEQVVRHLPQITDDVGYHPAGHATLRRAIADRYDRRGVPTDPGQIIVTNGAQQALSLLARALLKPGDRVVVEASTHPGALEAFREAAARLHTLPVGLPGLDAAARDVRPIAAYAIPTVHNPTGTVMPTPARRRLVDTAVAAGITLIEDEAFADLLFAGQDRPPPLCSYADSVIAIGSLSKTVWAGLRTGWLRAPAPVIAQLVRLRNLHDHGSNVPAQIAASYLLPRLDALVERRVADLERGHDHLRAQVARLIPDWEVPPVAGGHTLWGAVAERERRHLRSGRAATRRRDLSRTDLGGARWCRRSHPHALPPPSGSAHRSRATSRRRVGTPTADASS